MTGLDLFIKRKTQSTKLDLLNEIRQLKTLGYIPNVVILNILKVVQIKIKVLEDRASSSINFLGFVNLTFLILGKANIQSYMGCCCESFYVFFSKREKIYLTEIKYFDDILIEHSTLLYKDTNIRC